MYVNKSDCYCYCKTKKHPLEDLTMLEVALKLKKTKTTNLMVSLTLMPLKHKVMIYPYRAHSAHSLTVQRIQNAHYVLCL